MNCKKVGDLSGGKYDKMLECNKRVYSTEYCSPTITTCGGGNTEVKILEEPIAHDDQNGYLRTDGLVGTTNTDGIRKLTPQECGKLMGVKPCDIEKIGKNLSKSAQYHCYGDSIVTTVLMAIFGELLDIDYKPKINEVLEQLTEKE